MESLYSDIDKARALETLLSIDETLSQLEEWNKSVKSSEDYCDSPGGMQLLAATCMLLTAIGEGINRIKRSLPEFLESTYPDIPWKAIVGMRNHIAHGYFELDAEIVYETVSTNIPSLHDAIKEAISELKY